MWNALRYVVQAMGNALMTPEMAELNQKIENARRATEAAPDDPLQLDLLGALLGVRYSNLGTSTDLDESIQFARRAISVAPAGDPGRSRYLNNLFVGLCDRYLRTGNLTDLDEACRLGQEVVDLTSMNDRNWPSYASNLASQLRCRHSRQGVTADLDAAIKLFRKAIEVAAEHQTPQETFASNLAIALASKHDISGKESDLEEAVQFARSALDGTADDHPLRARRLSTLANVLADRHRKTRAIVDLKEAIQNAVKAAALIPDGHLDRPSYLNNLALLYGDLYTRTGSLEALNSAIELGQKALDMTPNGHPSRAAKLSNLAIQLQYRYGKTKAMGDLDKCIQYLREALRMTDPSHPDRAQWLNNLGVPLGVKYQETKAMSVLQEAVEITQKAVAALPDNHLHRAAYLNTLGDRLADRHSRTKTTDDLEATITSYQSALNQSSSTVLDRISAGRKVLQYHAIRSDWQKAYEDAKTAVGLIPRLSKPSLGNSDKQYVLAQIVGLACDAPAAALSAGKAPSVALGLLEQGRGVIATFFEDMRTDLVDLRAKYPELANDFIRIRSVLDTPAKPNMAFELDDRQASSKEFTSTRSMAEVDFDALIVEIRKRPGFETFLLPPSEEELKIAGSRGPIVVINVSELRSDALLVEPDEIRSVALPDFRISEIEAEGRKGDRGSPAVLGRLWDTVTKPVLDALGYTGSPSNNDWPHIWWIPTGRLSKFPLHAAGYHGKGSTNTVLDRAMSSYSSSIKAIIQGRRRRVLDVTPGKPAKALLVDMTHTPGQDRLDFAAGEVSLVQGICQSSSCEVILSTRKKLDVLSHLTSCNIFHFAGHGSTNEFDPLSSSLLLEDCNSDPLTVADLMENSLREHSPFLAFLSACGTGEMKDWKSFDESIHLISACQLAGFRHVIGTLWEVEDGESCLYMARIAYEEILHQGMTDESVALGLHKAARGLRDDWLRDTADSVDGRTPAVKGGPGTMVLGITEGIDHVTLRKATPVKKKTKPLLWVPYVHFGV